MTTLTALLCIALVFVAPLVSKFSYKLMDFLDNRLRLYKYVPATDSSTADAPSDEQMSLGCAIAGTIISFIWSMIACLVYKSYGWALLGAIVGGALPILCLFALYLYILLLYNGINLFCSMYAKPWNWLDHVFKPSEQKVSDDDLKRQIADLTDQVSTLKHQLSARENPPAEDV